jgi:hypothetical protein
VPVGFPEPLIPLGMRYGRLTVTGHAGTNDHGHHRVAVRCDCGNTRVVLAGNLRHHKTASCGCIRRTVARAAMTALHQSRRCAAKSAHHTPSP